MPTNLEVAIEKKFEAEKAAQFHYTLMLACFVACLVNLVLVFESPAYAAALILMGLLD